jgi:hypothetical protein
LEQIKLTDIIELLKRFLAYLLSKYKLIVTTTFITTLISFGYWYFQEPNYKATATFIVEEGSSKGGGLSGIASQFGIDIGGLLGGGSASLFSGENIFEIMKSKLIIEKVLTTNIQNPSNQKNILLADLYLEISGMRKQLNQKSIEFKNFKFVDGKNNSNNILYDSLMNVIYTRLITENLIIDKLNKKASIITISITSPSQLFAKNFTEKLLEQTSNLYIEIKTGNLSRSIAKIQHKADSLQNSLNNIYDRSYINLSRPMEATNRDKTVTYTLYGEVIKNLETLKISLINQTPIIQVLDLPKYPLKNLKYRLKILLLIGFAAGITLSSLIAILLYSDRKN